MKELRSLATNDAGTPWCGRQVTETLLRVGGDAPDGDVPNGDAAMLNLTQRLILGCTILAGLAVWLGAVALRPLAAAGHGSFALVLPIAAVVIAIGTSATVLMSMR